MKGVLLLPTVNGSLWTAIAGARNQIPAGRAVMGACFWRRCYGRPARAAHGATFRLVSANGTASSRASVIGSKRVFAGLFDLAMRMEREQFLDAGHDERSAGRRGDANGYKAKKLDTPAGTLSLHVPKTAGLVEGYGEAFYPQSLECGRRSSRAVMLAVAEMYVKGVSTRDAEAVMKQFGIESLSSRQVSRATKLLDDELSAWRNRSLGEVRYLIVDARYEKARFGGVVRDVAVLSAIGIGSDERRRVLGVSCA